MQRSSLSRPEPGAGGRRVSGPPRLGAGEYAQIHAFLEERCGIRLGDGKEYLVSSRLGRLLERQGLESYTALIQQLQRPGGNDLQAAVVDAMTTNETFWFRDPAHYRILTEHILPAHGSGRLRIWSAACSTGQEPYSLAMVLGDARRLGRAGIAPQVEILGTDISPTALGQARAARYCGMGGSRGLDQEQRRRYFRLDGDCLEVAPEYRRPVRFQELNLTRSFATLGRFDVVFCRNVLIYFSAERKRAIIEQMARLLPAGGHLFLGSTESLSGQGGLFEMVSLAGGLVYRRK